MVMSWKNKYKKMSFVHTLHAVWKSYLYNNTCMWTVSMFSLKAVLDVIPSFVTIIDEIYVRYIAHRVELIFHFSLSLIPPRFVLSRGG